MVDASLSLIKKSRKSFENPYAHLDGEGGFDGIVNSPDYLHATANEISKSRALLQDPYAYLDDNGDFSALSAQPKVELAESLHSKLPGTDALFGGAVKINGLKQPLKSATELHKEIWLRRDQIWGDNIPNDPVDLLDPEIALSLIGYQFELCETLGQYPGGRVEVAGMIDCQSKTVSVSRQFPRHVRRFTTAHELGHALLHETGRLHRDRALDGSSVARDKVEREADKFACYFLMPERLVKSRFIENFKCELFTVNEQTSFALNQSDLGDFYRKFADCHALARALAAADRFDGKQIKSLADQFGVSIEAMAIRLEELDLIDC